MRRLSACCVVALAVLAGFAGPAVSGALQLEGHGGPIKGVAVSPDGTAALTASFDYSVGLWSLLGGDRDAWAEGHLAAANAVAFHPDGTQFLSAGDDFALMLWDRATARPLHRFEGHRGKIVAVAVAPDGRHAATAGWDGTWGLWDLEARTGRLVEGHRGPVNDVAFSADGATLFTASYDGTIRAWDVATAEERATLVSHGFGVNVLALDAEGVWLAYGAVDGAVRAIDLRTRAEIADLTADRRPILALARSPSGDRLAVGDGEGHIMVIETAGWSITRDFRAALRGPIWALAWAGESLLAGGLADEAALWPVGDPGAAEALFAERRHFHRPPEEMGNGERQFVRKCAVCHTLTPDSGRRAGPTLFGIFGRPAGSLAGYRYSEALAGSGLVWTAETIDRLFADGPDRVTPGSKMPVQRIAKPEDRADLIAYLRAETGGRTPSGTPDGSSTE